MLLDLEKPIFVFNINIDGVPRQRSDELINLIVDATKYDNINSWYIPVKNQPTEISVIWKGKSIEMQNTTNYQETLKKFNRVVELVIDGCDNHHHYDFLIYQ